MNYYQFHISDWALHTSHLTLEEEAVYRRLLDFYYDTESPIPKETHPVIRRLRLGSHSETVALILTEFFHLADDGWHNNRADIEIAEYQSKAETARVNGKKGGRPKKNSGLKTQPVISGNPEETGSKANQEPRTINQEPLTNIKNTSSHATAQTKKNIYPGWFDSLWEKFPPRAGGNDKRKAFQAASARIAEGKKQNKTENEIVDDFVAAVFRYRLFVVATNKINTEYTMQTATFFGPGGHLENDWQIPAPKNLQRVVAGSFGANGSRSTRDIPLAENLTDRSWAD